MKRVSRDGGPREAHPECTRAMTQPRPPQCDRMQKAPGLAVAGPGASEGPARGIGVGPDAQGVPPAQSRARAWYMPAAAWMSLVAHHSSVRWAWAGSPGPRMSMGTSGQA